MPAAPRISFRLLSLNGLLLLPACSYDPSLDIHGRNPWEEEQARRWDMNGRALEERKEWRRQQSND